MGFEFFGNTAAHLYPSHCTDPAWQVPLLFKGGPSMPQLMQGCRTLNLKPPDEMQDSFRATLMKLNAYAAESQLLDSHLSYHED